VLCTAASCAANACCVHAWVVHVLCMCSDQPSPSPPPLPPAAAAWRLQLLLRSPKDRVHLIHVQQKGHSQGAAVGAGAPLSQHGSAALPPLLSPLGSASEGGLSLSIPAGSRPSPGSPFASSAPARASVLYVPPVPPGASVSGEPIYPGSHTAGSPALTQFGSAGWLGLRSSGSSGGWSLTGLNRTSHQRDSQPQQQEGCSELMERCRQQLLASSKRCDLCAGGQARSSKPYQCSNACSHQE
jgi:hypothetical protein